MGQWEHYEEGWEREREVGDLGCSMTPCLSKDIVSCMTILLKTHDAREVREG